MIRILLLAITTFIFLPGCQKQEQKLTVPLEKLVNILTDLQIANAGLATLSGISRDSAANRYMYQVCQINQIEEGTLKNNLDIIFNDPDLTVSIFEEVNKKLKEKNINQ